MSQYLSVRQAAVRLGVPAKMVEHWVRIGRLHKQPGHGLRAADVEALGREMAWVAEFGHLDWDSQIRELADDARRWIQAVLDDDALTGTANREHGRLLAARLTSVLEGQPPASPPWFLADAVEEANFMDLRRWLSRCHRDGRNELRLMDFPPRVRETQGDRLLWASDGRRSVERVVSPREQAWLLEHWPAELRDSNCGESSTEGRLT